jgi:hypothetical protein
MHSTPRLLRGGLEQIHGRGAISSIFKQDITDCRKNLS